MKYIDVHNLKYQNVIKNASFCISEKWNSFYFSGDTLIPILMGYEDYEGYINIDGNFLSKNNIYNLKNKLYYVDKNFYFVSNNLYNEFLLGSENIKLIDEYIIKFELSNYKYINIHVNNVFIILAFVVVFIPILITFVVFLNVRHKFDETINLLNEVSYEK